jgi:hypothetical protein
MPDEKPIKMTNITTLPRAFRLPRSATANPHQIAAALDALEILIDAVEQHLQAPRQKTAQSELIFALDDAKCSLLTIRPWEKT